MAAPRERDLGPNGLAPDNTMFEEIKPAGGSSKPVPMSLHLIVKRHLPAGAESWSQERILTELNKIKRVRLDREGIQEIDNLELLSDAVTHLFLQINQIRRIQNLECVPHLQVLILINNKIAQIEGLQHLSKLIFLDVSENIIDAAAAEDFPKSLIILNLAGNPCVSNMSHRSNLIQALPKLKQLNGIAVSSKEKNHAGFECELSDEDDGDDDSDGSSDEEDEVQENRIPSRIPTGCEGHSSANLSGLAYKQLPQIPTSIQDVTTAMLLRSQKRMEEDDAEHRRHVREITNIQIKTKIRPSPRLEKPN